MCRRSAAVERMEGYIIEALFQLMAQKPFAAITAGEIAARAGIDRSTYYRHFTSKEEVLRCFLARMMAQQPAGPALGESRQQRLEELFRFYQGYRRQLLLLYDSGQFSLLLELIDQPFEAVPSNAMLLAQQYDLAYHLGGVFSQLLLWLARRMRDDPAELARRADAMLPPEFAPVQPLRWRQAGA